MRRIVRVLLDRALDRPLDYLLPESITTEIGVGSRVRVPLKQQLLPGTVLDLPAESPFPNLRPVEAVLGEAPVILPVLLRIAKWMAAYYCCSLEESLRTVLPAVVRKGEMEHRQIKGAEPSRSISAEELEKLAARAPKQAEVLAKILSATAPLPVVQIEREIPDASAAVRALEKKGMVRVVGVQIRRDPLAADSFVPDQPLVFNEEQQIAFQRVIERIEHPAKGRPLLLHGVTGSGKTEIYLQAVQHALDLGKTALILVPEISLAPQTVERFRSRFASSNAGVAVLHSHLSAGERHDEWFRIHSGKARIVIGARSAVFAPLSNLGILIVDEEHEPSYKQEESPRYQARDIAVLRASMEPCAILLGSATPSMESHLNATNGKYELLSLRTRADDRALPIIRILDLRVQKTNSGSAAAFSPPLIQAINSRLDKKEQILLFLNRRGYSTSIVCPSCGHVCTCPDCSIALTFHRDAGRAICHLCGHTSRAPRSCPSCSSPEIKHSGTGTQKIEEAVQRTFPKARIARMDADAMARKDAYREVFTQFRKGAIDILVGTQMIAKGLHFPNVTLVGILNADLGLHIPDFRAGERTFQLLTQVAGRAGRGEMEGEVFVQTYTPFASAIQFSRHHDFQGFWEEESSFRQKFHYPPYYRMVLLTVRSPREELAEFTAQTLRRKLAENLPEGIILGASAPSPLAKAKGRYRFQIALRAPKSATMTQHIRSVLDKLPLPEEVHLTIDVDPYQLL